MCARTFGLDQDRVINQYITTLLLLQEDEGGAGDHSTYQEDLQPLCHADALERVLQVIPMLHSTSELTDSLCAAILKVCQSFRPWLKNFKFQIYYGYFRTAKNLNSKWKKEIKKTLPHVYLCF